jgi:hypothetical protein
LENFLKKSVECIRGKHRPYLLKHKITNFNKLKDLHFKINPVAYFSKISTQIIKATYRIFLSPQRVWEERNYFD